MRRILLPDEADFSQEYWMSFKKNRGSMAAKDPLVGRIDNFQTGPNKNRKLGESEIRVACAADYPNLRLLQGGIPAVL